MVTPTVPRRPASERLNRGDQRYVLIVDDNVDYAVLMSKLLAYHGFPVATASRGSEAIETARFLRPRVILLDIALPDMDGFQLAEILRREVGLEGSSFIAVTVYEPESIPGDAREALFDHYLVKPVDPNRLLTILTQESLARSRPPCE
jgi:CheY-like chemotaxis protein